MTSIHVGLLRNFLFAEYLDRCYALCDCLWRVMHAAVQKWHIWSKVAPDCLMGVWTLTSERIVYSMPRVISHRLDKL